jgi:parvulin-like peptidyl-prolyl isomerase
VAASTQDVERVVESFRQRNYPTRASYERYLRGLGRTEEDQLFKVQTELDSEAIRRAIKKQVGPVTSARLASYYASHRHLFHVPEARNVEIVRAESQALALAVKRGIAAGRSFADALKGNSLPQPIFSKNGLVRGYTSGTYAQRPLNDAIMSARPGVLSGPVKISLGYYVFEVRKVLPAHEKPLAAVSSSLRRQLPEQLQQHALVAYIARWRRQWLGRTDCRPGYVISKCRQYRSSGTGAPEDPYTLD